MIKQAGKLYKQGKYGIYYRQIMPKSRSYYFYDEDTRDDGKTVVEHYISDIIARYDFDNDPEFANLTPEQKEAKKKHLFMKLTESDIQKLITEHYENKGK